MAQFASLCHVAEDIMAVVKDHAMFTIPISARVAAAQSVNTAMLGILSSVNAKGGAFANGREVHHITIHNVVVVVVVVLVVVVVAVVVVG